MMSIDPHPFNDVNFKYQFLKILNTNNRMFVFCLYNISLLLNKNILRQDKSVDELIHTTLGTRFLFFYRTA